MRNNGPKLYLKKTRICTKRYKNDAIRNDVISLDENYFQTVALVLRFHKISMGFFNPTNGILQSNQWDSSIQPD